MQKTKSENRCEKLCKTSGHTSGHKFEQGGTLTGLAPRTGGQRGYQIDSHSLLTLVGSADKQYLMATATCRRPHKKTIQTSKTIYIIISIYTYRSCLRQISALGLSANKCWRRPAKAKSASRRKNAKGEVLKRKTSRKENCLRWSARLGNGL